MTPISNRALVPLNKLSLLCVLASVLLAFEAAATEANTHIRTLASSCVTCHGTHALGKSVISSLAGFDASYFMEKMQAYRGSANVHEVMAQHAKGLTE